MDDIRTETTAFSLLADDETPAARRINPRADADLVIVCDHAANRVPRALERLGLTDDSLFERHIAYDIGAEAVTEILARELDAVAVLSSYSRLVIDPNRAPGHPQSIPEVSDGVAIPANQDLPLGGKEARLATFFDPYHQMIGRTFVDTWHARGRPSALFSVHSFSPRFGDTPRPWDAGILWDRDPRIAPAMMDNLRAQGLTVGDNEPYSGREVAYTVDVHGGACGVANCAVEINQDQISDRAGIERWAAHLIDALRPILDDQRLYDVAYF